MKSHLNQVRRVTKQKGMTLIELGVGLAIAAAVIAGALAMYVSTSSSQKSNQLNTDLTSIRASVQSLHQRSGDYGTASLNQVLIDATMLPSTIRNTTGTTLRHGLSATGTLTITGNTTDFSIAVTAVPQESCVQLLTAAGGWDSITVGSTTFAEGDATNPIPVSPVQASSACSDDVTLTYVAS